VFETQLEYFCAQLLHSSKLVRTQLTVTVHQRAAMQQLSAKVFQLSFEYLHIYIPKVAIFAEKKQNCIINVL